MGRTASYYTFVGQFEGSVLGTFRIIRGFASLKDLAAVSVPYEMDDGGADGAGIKGQQRRLDTEHAERIKRYLESGERRFLPEVILSVRTALIEEVDQTQIPVGVMSLDPADGILIKRMWKSRRIRVHGVRVKKSSLNEIKRKKLIRRVDGNHRLALADKLQDDASVPTKYLAPFCIVLLEPPGNEADDYSESLIFHTINSTALPLESEHALKLILGQHPDYDMEEEKEFAFSPDLHFTRLLRDGLLKLPAPVKARLGSRPLTFLHRAACGLLEMDPAVAGDLESMRRYARELLAALVDIVTRLEPTRPTLCQADFFIELAARAWKASPEDTHAKQVNSVVAYLDRLSLWLGVGGLTDLKENRSLSKQLIDIYKAVSARSPKRVFLARWYPETRLGAESEAARLRLKQIKQTLSEIGAEDDVHLELVDMGTQTGGTFPIHPRMYDAILSADIILVDLTGVRPNVCVEAGFALRNHEKNRLIFIFQPTKDNKTVPFDLNTFRYESFTDTGRIPEILKPHIVAILRDATNGV